MFPSSRKQFSHTNSFFFFPANNQILANFGSDLTAHPFRGDIEAIRKSASDRLYAKILATVVPKASKSQDVVGELVFNYLTHHGHWDTAASVARDVLGGTTSVPTHAKNEAAALQRLATAVRSGDIDASVEISESLAPGVLMENPRVAFALQCQKFCELVRNEGNKQPSE